ncbi:LysR substrate-binding domain-containing protein [Streptomyces sp. NPDC052077]|uniref:LysR substrate-binding domain-containing protein n=1 Tax=Streptomyces sp. NPDC052077 TaxID=3154757 RepID=UPI003413BD94
MGFSLRQLRYFIAVAEAGQFSAAARELYISQSTITTSVQGIERHLGHRVFERSVHGVELTDAGRALLPKARHILDLVADAETTVAGDPGIAGRVRVGASYTVMGYFLPHHIQRVSARYPGVVFEWHEMHRDTMEQRLIDGDLDLAFLLTSNVRDDGLDFETFVCSPRRLWTAPTHPLAGRTNLRLADVAEHPYAMLTVDESEKSTRSYWPDLRPDVFVATSSIEAIRSLVANGTAVTVLSDMVYRPWSLEGRRIHAAALADPIPDMQIGLAWASAHQPTPAMTALRQYFADTFHVSR